MQENLVSLLNTRLIPHPTGNLLCPLCSLEVDTQSHILNCSVLKNNTNINTESEHEYIHGSLKEQVLITTLYSSLLERGTGSWRRRQPTEARQYRTFKHYCVVIFKDVLKHSNWENLLVTISTIHSD